MKKKIIEGLKITAALLAMIGLFALTGYEF